GTDDVRKTPLECVDGGSRIINAERRLRDVGHWGIGGQIELLDIVPVADEIHGSVKLADRAFDLRMAGMADQNHSTALVDVALPLAVDFGDQGTGRVQYGQLSDFGIVLDGPRHAMGTEDRDHTERHLRKIFHEASALCLQALNNIAVVHDLVAHVDRRSILRESPLDDLDGADDASTVAARLRQDDLHASPNPEDARFTRAC